MLRPRPICAAAALVAANGVGIAVPATSAVAADLPAIAAPAPALPAWTFFATGYAWLPSINGTSTVRGRTTDVDATFFDLVDREIPKQLLALMGAFEARRGPVSLMTDIAYMKLGAGGDAVRVRNVRPEVGGTLSAAASADFEMVIAEIAAAYEFARWTVAAAPLALDLYGGARFWWQRAEARLSLDAGVTIADLVIERDAALAASGDVTWLDPLIGLRLRYQLSPDAELTLRGDVGGFGLGSDFSWQTIATANWTFSRTEYADWSAMLGYRALYVDFETGSGRRQYGYDMLMHGPILGVTARF